jgi:hypothetical protein
MTPGRTPRGLYLIGVLAARPLLADVLGITVGDLLVGPVVERRPLMTALAELPPRQRACVVFRYFDDMSVGQRPSAPVLGRSCPGPDIHRNGPAPQVLAGLSPIPWSGGTRSRAEASITFVCPGTDRDDLLVPPTQPSRHTFGPWSLPRRAGVSRRREQRPRRQKAWSVPEAPVEAP